VVAEFRLVLRFRILDGSNGIDVEELALFLAF